MLCFRTPVDIIVDKSILQSKLIDLILIFRVFDQKVCSKYVKTIPGNIKIIKLHAGFEPMTNKFVVNVPTHCSTP